MGLPFLKVGLCDVGYIKTKNKGNTIDKIDQKTIKVQVLIQATITDQKIKTLST